MLPDLKIGELNGRNGVLLRGPELEDDFGHSVSAGDFNGDGFADVIVGKSGAAYIFYGSAAGLPTEIDLGQDASVADVTLTGGTSVALAAMLEARFIGDVNGDGFDDIVLAGFPWDTGSAFEGGAYIVYGGDSIAPDFDVGALDGSNGFALTTEAPRLQFGTRATELGDINGDGVDDFSVSNRDTHFIFFGSQSGRPASIDVDTLAPEDGVKIDASLASTWIKPVGDLDGDGIDDFMLSAQWTEVEGVEDAGVVYVIYGQPETFPGVITEGVVAQISVGADDPLSRYFSGDSLDLGPAEGREAVHDGDADLDFGGLAVGVS